MVVLIEVSYVSIIIRKYRSADLNSMRRIWNEVVEEGNAFPQDHLLQEDDCKHFFSSQSYCAVAVNDQDEICGLYILHPNNVGRCGHISNASYAVDKKCRGQHIGRELVKDCLNKAGELGFRILQFNAVVASNLSARHLYEKLGFISLGTVKKGFRNKFGEYEDICLYYHDLKETWTDS